MICTGLPGEVDRGEVCEAAEVIVPGRCLERLLAGDAATNLVLRIAKELKIYRPHMLRGKVCWRALAFYSQAVILVDAGEAGDVEHLTWQTGGGPLRL